MKKRRNFFYSNDFRMIFLVSTQPRNFYSYFEIKKFDRMIAWNKTRIFLPINLSSSLDICIAWLNS